MKQRNLASVGAVVWRACGGVRGRAAWRVTSAVPGVVRKADIQIQPAPWVVRSYLVVSAECQLTSPRRAKSTQSRRTGAKSTQTAAKCAKPSICFRCCPVRYSSRDLALAVASVAGFQIVYRLSISLRWLRRTSPRCGPGPVSLASRHPSLMPRRPAPFHQSLPWPQAILHLLLHCTAVPPPRRCAAAPPRAR